MKSCGPYSDAAFLAAPLSCQRIGLLLVLGAVVEARVARSHAVVGDQRSTLHRSQRRQVGFAVVAGIRGDQCALGQHIGQRRHGGQQQLLLGAGAVGPCFDDHLVPGVHRSHAGVALDYAFARCHLGRLVVGAVALAHGAA